MQRFCLRAFVTLFVCLGTALPSAAQSNSGSLIGVVRDSSGAVVPGATVTIVNLATNDTLVAVSDGEGRYEMPVVPVGRYRVEIALAGFKTQTVDALAIGAGQRARVDATLEVGGIGEEVRIEAEALLKTADATFGDSIGAARIENLPVNGRDFTLLLATVPGSVQSSNFFQTSLNGVPTWFGQSVLVDGIDAGRGDLNGLSNALGRIDARVNRISMDSIAEIQVLEQTYSAQYGQSMGTIVNPITKSGGNAVHGGLFEYFRDDALDATDFFANARGLGKQELRLNQFGGNLSGPVVRDRMFFFTNYEGVRQRRGTVLQGLVPTAAFRQQFSTGMAPVVAALPLPNQSFATNDPRVGLFSRLGLRELREDTGSLKLDWNASAAQRLSARYNINDSNTTTPYGIGERQIADGPLRVQLFKFNHMWVASSAMVNDFAVGLNRNYTYPEGGDRSLPRFDFTFVDAALASPGPALFAQERTTTNVQLLDTLTVIRGAHSIKAGFDIRINRRSARPDPVDTYIFFSLNDFAANAPFIVQRSGHPQLDYENENYSLFLQDDWRVNARLSLNLGVRYDVSSVSREAQGRLQNYDFASNTYTAPGEKIHDPDLNNIAPRLGLAWDLAGNQKTIVRAGYGIFYNQELPASFGSPQNNTFPTLTVNVFDAFFGGLPLSYPVDPRVFALAPPSARSNNQIDPKLRTPYSHQWSVNLQRDLGGGTMGEVSYIGNAVRKMTAGSSISARNLNRLNPFFGVRPNPNVGEVYDIAGYPASDYNALQVSFRKRFAGRLGFNAHYTLGHLTDDAVGFLKDYQDPDDVAAELADGDVDIRHNFTFDFTWALPAAPALPAWIGAGWQVSSITQLRSGLPVTATVTGGFFGGSLRPDAVPGVDPKPDNYSVPDHQFDPAAFVAPAFGKYGNVGRNTLRAPGFAQVDLSLIKNTRIANTHTIQVRFEVFNAFNRANFAAPFSGLNRDPITNSLSPSLAFGQSFSTVGDELGGLLGAGGPRQMQIAVRYTF